MQIKLFTIPVLDCNLQEEEMNAFLRGHKVLEVIQQFHQDSQNAFWSFCVRYIEGVPVQQKPFRSSVKTDYKSVLKEHEFDIFSRLRECRKQIAREEALPAYAVFIDEELAAFSRMEELTEKNILIVEGVGTKKMERFGKRLIELYNHMLLLN